MTRPLRTREASATSASDPTRKPAPTTASRAPKAPVPPSRTLTAKRKVSGYAAPRPATQTTIMAVLARSPRSRARKWKPSFSSPQSARALRSAAARAGAR